MINKFIDCLAILIATSIVIIFLFFGYDLYLPYSKKFNSDEWMKAKGCESNVRCKMIKDLDQNYLSGMVTQEEIYKLLGDPDNLVVRENNNFLAYDLNICSIFGQSFSYLEFSTDRNSKKIIGYDISY